MFLHASVTATNGCGDAGIAASHGVEDQLPPRRTLRRMYEDPSHHKKDEFLYGLESAPATFKPESSTRNTIFHTGFYRGIVKGQVLEPEHCLNRAYIDRVLTEPRQRNGIGPGIRFTCCTSAKVQIRTQKEEAEGTL